ncbi:MAG: hypothetical protein RLZZ358_1792 [Bacteroidota bacterium]
MHAKSASRISGGAFFLYSIYNAKWPGGLNQMATGALMCG